VRVVNPGSAGQPIDHANGRRHSYAVLDTATGEFMVDDFDLEPALHA
jgi:predicted phosphodiesterase